MAQVSLLRPLKSMEASALTIISSSYPKAWVISATSWPESWVKAGVPPLMVAMSTSSVTDAGRCLCSRFAISLLVPSAIGLGQDAAFDLDLNQGLGDDFRFDVQQDVEMPPSEPNAGRGMLID